MIFCILTNEFYRSELLWPSDWFCSLPTTSLNLLCQYVIIPQIMEIH